MAAPPTYLFVLPWSLEHPGGVNQVVLNLAREAQADGRYRPLVLIADWDAPAPVFGEHQGLATVRWRLRGWPPPGRLRAAVDRWLMRPRFHRRFARFCRDENVRVVNCHYLSDSGYGLLTALRARSLDPPFVISVHGTDVTTAAADGALAARSRRLLQACTAVVAPSRSLAQRCCDELGLQTAPAVIHNGLALQAFKSPPRAAPAVHGRVVLSIGKFERQKGQDVLIDAFSQLAAEFDDLQLWLIGASAPALPALRQQAARSPGGARIRFHADLPHAQVIELLRAARLFVLPSRQESFGLVLLEAGSLNVPVVATHVGGIPEVVTDGETGRLVPPDDAGALAAAMREVLQDPDAAQARAARLAARVERDFSWTRAYQAYIALIG